MDANKFLALIWPDEGTHCVVSIKNKTVRHYFYETVDSAVNKATSLNKAGADVYYALAAFEKGTTRRLQSKVTSLQCMFLDLDCGPGKEYKTQEEAMSEVDRFCEDINLPLPYMVNSGNGVHAYWALTEAVSKSEWDEMAYLLAAACRRHDLFADSACTTDSARILRPPGSHNRKDPDSPKEVFIVDDGEDVSPKDFIDTLLALDLPKRKERPKKVNPSDMSETMKALLGDKTSNFGKIARRSLNGSGCAFIKHALINQDKVEEPEWRAALSIAWHCDDGEKAIHKLSSKHPGYDPAETANKASMTTGPYLCSTIQLKAPGHCDGCPHNISSPIQLGSQVKDVASKPPALPDMPSAIPGELFGSNAKKAKEKKQAEEESVSDITVSPDEKKPASLDPDVYKVDFKPPWPYVVGESGAVYNEVSLGDGEKEQVLVYERPFYAVARINDPNYGECVTFRVHFKLDGVREFTVPVANVMASEKFKAELGKHGIVGGLDQMKRIMDYSIKFVKQLQDQIMAAEARTQFGWVDGDTKFCVGARVYNQDGNYEHAPSSSVTDSIVHMFEPIGTLDKWKQTINALSLPKMEPLQFGALVGFGSPLLKFTGVKGLTINLISNDSGSGKSTAELIAMSVFGSPASELKMADTHMSKMNRFGVMNNLALMSDEMTGLPPEQVSSMIYQVTDGRGRNRMERDANIERVNTTTWALMFLINSNSSFSSKLSHLKSRSDGEMMRLLEFNVEKVVVEDGYEIFAQLNDNYGVAGEIYAPYIVKHRDQIIDKLEQQRKRLIKSVGHRQEERFWVAGICATLVGARIAYDLGLHNLDIDRLERWLMAELERQREGVLSRTASAQQLVSSFLSDNLGGTIVVGVKRDPVTGQFARKIPVQRVVARFEDNGNKLFITRKSLEAYCVDRQFTITEALRELEKDRDIRFLGKARKRMMAGSGQMSAPIDTLEFTISPDLELFDAEVGN